MLRTFASSRSLAILFALVGCVATSACGKGTEPTKVYDVPALVSTDSIVGTGTEATNGRVTTVHYSGYLYDPTAASNKGAMFDSSVGRQPFAFTLGTGSVIQGWDQGVRGMKVGGKRTLTIPSGLGYGSRGSGSIPPNSALVFDIELLNVQ